MPKLRSLRGVQAVYPVVRIDLAQAPEPPDTNVPELTTALAMSRRAAGQASRLAPQFISRRDEA